MLALSAQNQRSRNHGSRNVAFRGNVLGLRAKDLGVTRIPREKSNHDMMARWKYKIISRALDISIRLSSDTPFSPAFLKALFWLVSPTSST